MPYTLTDQEFGRLEAYFHLAMTAISDEEQYELIIMEPGLRDMLKEIKKIQDQ